MTVHRPVTPSGMVVGTGGELRPPSTYRTLRRPDHPLARTGGAVFEHRAVLYDEIGGGGHPCHYCGIVVYWQYDLVVDHVDEDKTNNSPANLVPSCTPCNIWKHWYVRKNPGVAIPRRTGVTRTFDDLTFSERISFRPDEYDPWELEEVEPEVTFPLGPRRFQPVKSHR